MRSTDRRRSTEISGAIVRSAPNAVVVTSTDSVIMDFNPAAERMFGMSKADAIGRDVVDTIVPEFLRSEFRALGADLYAGNLAPSSNRFRSFGLRADGTTFPVEFRIESTSIGIDDTETIVLIGFITDRTDDSAAAQLVRIPDQLTIDRSQVREVRENLSVVLRSAPVLVFAMDLEGIIRLSTGGLLATFGFEPGQLVGSNTFEIYGDRTDITDHYRRAIAGEDFRVQVQLGGLWFDTQYQPMFSENGELEGTLGLSVDITAQIVSERALRHLVETDTVTGLSSRFHTEKLLDEALATAVPLTLILIDLDEFRHINDSHGHAMGDRVLSNIGERIRETLPPRSIIGRLGGDELIVGLPTQHPAQAALAAQAILAAVSRPMRISVDVAGVCSELDITITASIGMALAPADGATTAELLTHANIALYAAKRSGRASYKFYSSDKDGSTRRLSVTTRLRRAIDAGDIQVEYQPIYDLESNTVAGFEALARWNDSHLGPVSPEEFIALAESSPLIDDLFDLVLHQALRAAVDWNACTPRSVPDDWRPRRLGGRMISVSINVAARQLHDPRLPSRIIAAALSVGLPLDCVMIELTESAMMDDGPTTQGVLKALRDAGMGVVIDDYGIGYSNMARLGELSTERILDGVKIDRTFIANLPAQQATTLVKMFLTMTDSLGVAAVAEGVETAEHLQILRGLGYHYAQGYYFAKPMSALDATELVCGN
ncbi:EAL domain-containing protein [Antrihabitans sp. NCIMB 15449]|uniref:EAL domain-containing protein n=1 Tax=Antrihabitans spumae TaxID=3373370 RepID=A0ABW7JKQ9_9NOCA